MLRSSQPRCSCDDRGQARSSPHIQPTTHGALVSSSLFLFFHPSLRCHSAPHPFIARTLVISLLLPLPLRMCALPAHGI